MLEFGKLEIVEKTFTREAGQPRGQNYEGIKFRRAKTAKGGVEGVDERFIVSNKAFEALDLKNLALTQAKTDNAVLLLVLEDKEGANPPAKFMRQSVKKDGTKQEKGKFFSNEFLLADLEAVGVLTKGEFGNQYLKLVDVTGEIAGRPDHVKAIYNLIKDESVDASADEGEEADTAEAAPADAQPANKDY